MSQKHFLSIIVPAYNEAKTLGQVIESLYRNVTNIDFEVIVVDDGSTDQTKKILNKVSKKHPRLKSLHHQNNKGKSEAIKSGVKMTEGNLILIQDADLEYNPSEINTLVDTAIQSYPCLVYGSRNLQHNPRFSRTYHLGGVFLSKVCNSLYGGNLTDICTGYKIFPKQILENIELTEGGFGFCFEITSKALNHDYSILEIPIGYNPRSTIEGKKIKITDGLYGFWILVKNFKFT